MNGPAGSGRREHAFRVQWTLMGAIAKLLARTAAFLVEALVRLYQVALRPLLIGGCKFHPTCSEYFIEAVREWGVFRGGWMGLKRIGRCLPFGMGGLDPVPRRPTSDRR